MSVTMSPIFLEKSYVLVPSMRSRSPPKLTLAFLNTVEIIAFIPIRAYVSYVAPFCDGSTIRFYICTYCRLQKDKGHVRFSGLRSNRLYICLH